MRIIEFDNEIVGKIEDLEKYLREEMVYQLKSYDLSIEEIKYNCNLMFDILLEIQENEQDNYNNECLFKIYQTPTGNYEYKVLKESK